jgi:phosphoesterase RecJ-like protein
LYEKIVENIKKNKNILLLTHKNPDVDAVGSVYALARFIKKKFNNNIKIIFDDYSERNNIIKKFDSEDLDLNQIKLVIVLDCGDKKRLGSLEEIVETKFIINIDHHISNSNFGNLNIVIDVSSTCEIIFEFINKIDKSCLDNDIASCLYAGIICDTGGMRFSNTTARTHKIISKLLKFDFNFSEIYNKLLILLSIEEINLLKIALNNFKIINSLAICCLNRDSLRDIKNKSSSLLVNFLKNICGIEIAVVIMEIEEDMCKVSFRSNNFDVCKTAKKFGGGGHKLASGCLIKDNLSNTQKKILECFKDLDF